MRKRLLTVLVVEMFLCAACAKPAPGSGRNSRALPHVSWVIMHGDRDNPDAEFACQSEPRNDCVVPASKPNAQVFSDIHFYYHGAGPQTKFTGTVHIGFLGESRGANGFEVNTTAEKAKSIAYQSISGIVSSTPGMYDVAIDVIGTVGATQTSQPVRQTIPVVVR